jgi:hypothetical protein
VILPAKMYPAGTQPFEVVRDCAETAGKLFGVVIHHSGVSHLCLFYTLETDHATYSTSAKISDHVDEWDPDDTSTPVWEPHWEAGRATRHDGQVLLSGIVSTYGNAATTFVQHADNVQDYDYWVEVYHDNISTTEDQAADRAAGVLVKRKVNHLTHSVSVIVNPNQVHLVAAGMSIQIKAAAAIGGQYLDTWQTRRIAELRWEPRMDGRYWAHMELDRTKLGRVPNGGSSVPPAPTPTIPTGGPITDYLWTFNTDNKDDTTGTYEVGTIATNWHPGMVHTHVLNPSVGNFAASTKPPISPGTYHIRAIIRRGTESYNGDGITFTVWSFDGGVDTELWTSAPETSLSPVTVESDITFPAGADFMAFQLNDNASELLEVELTHGTTIEGFEGTPPPPASTDSEGSIGTSPIYSPSDHQHPVQTAEVTPINDAGGYFVGGNVEEALQELAGGVTSSLGWFNVLAYGATGDGTTDDTSSINDAIADVNASTDGGVLYFPAGHYKVTAALTSITKACLILGDGMASRDGTTGAVSRISCTSATAALFTIAAHSTQIQNLALVNTAGGTPSAGGGIVITSGDHTRIRECTISGFWINVDFQDGAHWSMQGCYLHGPVKYALKIRHVDLPDGGDQTITDCLFYAKNHDADAGIRVESGGGLKIVNCKINEDFGPEHFNHGIDMAIGASVNTGDIQVTATSIENIDGDAFRMTTNSSKPSHWGTINLTGLQVATWGNTTGSAVNINADAVGDIDDVSIIGLQVLQPTSTGTAVALTNVRRAYIGGIVNDYANPFSALVATSGCTDIIDASSGAGGTASGELGGSYPSPTIDATHSGSAHTDFIAKAIVDQKGDIIAATAADTVSRLGVGTDGEVLMADSGESTGLKWDSPPGGDPGDDAYVWMPLTTVVGSDPELVWDGDDSLIPTLTPI